MPFSNRCADSSTSIRTLAPSPPHLVRANLHKIGLPTGPVQLSARIAGKRDSCDNQGGWIMAFIASPVIPKTDSPPRVELGLHNDQYALMSAEIATSLDLSPPAPLRWWRQRHSWFAAAVMLLNAAACVGCYRFYELETSWTANIPNLEIVLIAGFLGLLYGHLALLGLWCAVGGLPTLLRWGCAAALVTVVCVGLSDFWGEVDETIVMMVTTTLFGVGTLFLLAVLMLPLRTVFHLRIDFRPDYHPPAERPRGQWRFVDFFVWSLAIAIPLALYRAVGDFSEDFTLAEALPVLFAICLPAFVTALSTAGILLWRGPRLVLAWLGWLAWVTALIFMMSYWELADFDPFDGPSLFFGVKLGHAAFIASAALTAFTSVGVLRLAGLALFSLPTRTVQ